MSIVPADIEPESSIDKGISPTAVHTLEADDLGHVPKSRFSPKKFAKSLGSKEAWLGDYVSNCPTTRRLRVLAHSLGLCSIIHPKHPFSHQEDPRVAVLWCR